MNVPRGKRLHEKNHSFAYHPASCRMYQPGGFLDSQTTDSQIDFHTNEGLSEFQEIITKEDKLEAAITLINDDDKELESLDTEKMFDEIARNSSGGHADLETQDHDDLEIFTEESQEPFYDHGE